MSPGKPSDRRDGTPANRQRPGQIPERHADNQKVRTDARNANGAEEHTEDARSAALASSNGNTLVTPCVESSAAV